jgi:glycosyltransferase involved in cell wall biosynthesis
MVVPGNTGFLAGEVSACSMSEELGRLLANSEKLERMRSDCRRFAEDKWDPKKLKVRFEEITGELVPGSKAKR